MRRGSLSGDRNTDGERNNYVYPSGLKLLGCCFNDAEITLSLAYEKADFAEPRRTEGFSQASQPREVRATLKDNAHSLRLLRIRRESTTREASHC